MESINMSEVKEYKLYPIEQLDLSTARPLKESSMSYEMRELDGAFFFRRKVNSDVKVEWYKTNDRRIVEDYINGNLFSISFNKLGRTEEYKKHQKTEEVKVFIINRELTYEGDEMFRQFEEKGLVGVFEENPDLEVIEISGFENFVVPDNIGSLENLKNLALLNPANIPASLANCTKLELVGIIGCNAHADMNFLLDLPEIAVVNLLDCPNVVINEDHEKVLNEELLLVVGPSLNNLELYSGGVIFPASQLPHP